MDIGNLIEINHKQIIKIPINNIININQKFILELLKEKFIGKFNLNFLVIEITDLNYDKFVEDDINYDDSLLVKCECKLIGIEIYKNAKLYLNNINEIKFNDESNSFYYIKDNIFLIIKNIESLIYEENKINNQNFENKKINLVIINDPIELKNDNDEEKKLIFVETNIEF